MRPKPSFWRRTPSVRIEGKSPPLPHGRRPGDDAPPPVLRDPEALLRDWAAVALFADRAQMARPDFRLAARNAPAVAELVARLDGIPLAIELAAARSQVLTPRRMLDQLDRIPGRFDLLVNRRRGAPARHRSLRETIAWSFELLSPGLRRLFARLSVFRGGWSAEAAEAVTGDALVLDGLAQLCDASLARAEPSGEDDASGDGGMRFTMLETLREFAQEQFEGAERAEAERRHAGHFLALAESAEPQLHGPEQKAWLDRLEAEHDNLRAALEWAEQAAGEEAARTGLRLAGALPRFWRLRGYLSDGRRRTEAALARGRELPPDAAPLLAKARNGAGILAMTQGDWDEARGCYQECLSLHRALGDDRGVAATLNNLAILASKRGRLEEARVHYEESLLVWRRLGEKRNIAIVLANLGADALTRRDLAVARRLLEESLALARETGNTRSEAGALHNLAEVAYKAGDRDAAERLYLQSLTLLRALGDVQTSAHCVLSLGFVARARGDAARAHQLIEAALETCRSLGVPLTTFARSELERIGQAAASGSEPLTAASSSPADPPLTLARAIASLLGAPAPDDGTPSD